MDVSHCHWVLCCKQLGTFLFVSYYTCTGKVLANCVYGCQSLSLGAVLYISRRRLPLSPHNRLTCSRNPDHWQDPDEFKPERFLDDAKIPFFAYQPFICGPHTCIGNKFALQELRLALAMLLQRFEFSPLPDVTYRKKQVITLQPDPKLTLRVRLVQ